MLIDKIPSAPNSIYAEKIVNGGVTKMVVYISGVSGNLSDEARRWGSPVFGTWSFGTPYAQVSSFIAAQDKLWNPKEIMLVGYSNGGMQAQAYAATAPQAIKGKIKMTVTFASPAIKMANEIPGQVLNIRAKKDPIAGLTSWLNKAGTIDSYANAGLTKINYWFDGNSHDRSLYQSGANAFDTAARQSGSYLLTLRDSISRFSGSPVANSGVKSIA